VRSKIIGLTLLVSLLAITLFGLPLAVGVRQYALAYERSELERVADGVALLVSADLLRDTTPPLPSPPRPGVQLAAYDVDGRRVVGEGPARADVLVRQALAGETARGGDAARIAVAVTVSHDGVVIGAVRVSEGRDMVTRRIVLAFSVMLALAVAALAGGWLLARSLASRLARPLEYLARTAGRLGEGDFSVRSGTSSIPEIDAVGAALDRAAERLDDLVTRERAFSAEASHQLRTPLTGMRVRLEAVLAQPGDPRPAITAALADADRLEQTIQELLGLARGDRADRRELDVAPLLAEVEATWQPRLRSTGRDVIVRVDDRAPVAVASAAAVRQILGVLLDNAATHGRGTVTVRVREANGALAVDVADEGRIALAEDQLFQRRAGSSTGHGIGLALARRLTEAEHGRLTLSDRAPSTFTLLLPALDDG
jgi:signal transduction histidine kinase